jgi:hypothetical protein
MKGQDHLVETPNNQLRPIHPKQRMHWIYPERHPLLEVSNREMFGGYPATPQ